MYASSAIELIDKARTEWLKLHGDEDPIIKLISQIDLDSLGPIESLDETDQLIMKLKTRLFVAKQDLAETNEDEVLG